MPGNGNICNEHKMCTHRIESIENRQRLWEIRLQKMEVDMIDIKNNSKISIAVITVIGGIISSGITLAGVIAVPLLRGWLGL